MPRHNAQNSGLTLLEVSIVLVVIALVIGGVFLGQNLITGARIRAVISDIERFSQAVGAFRDKYDAFPGDMPNAESFWGSDAACPATPTNAIPKRETCNGNGNERIGDYDSGTTTLSDYYEWFRAWQHLANARMIEGSFTGVTGPDDPDLHGLPGVNLPKTPLRRGRYWLTYYDALAGDASSYAARYQNYFTLDAADPLDAGVTLIGLPVLTPAEAFSIDGKMDDGRPGQGNVLATKPAAHPNCATDADPQVAAYDLSYTTQASCILNFVGFIK